MPIKSNINESIIYEKLKFKHTISLDFFLVCCLSKTIRRLLGIRKKQNIFSNSSKLRNKKCPERPVYTKC
jgi:hypothetical protein